MSVSRVAAVVLALPMGCGARLVGEPSSGPPVSRPPTGESVERGPAAPPATGAIVPALPMSPTPSASITSAPSANEEAPFPAREYVEPPPPRTCAAGGELVGNTCVAATCAEGTYYDSDAGCLPLKPPEECVKWRPNRVPAMPGMKVAAFVKRGPDCPCRSGQCTCQRWTSPLPAETLESCKKACAAGTGELCARIGETYRVGLQLKPQLDISRQYFDKACAFGDGWSCLFLGTALLRGAPWPKEEAAGRAALERACARKVGCWELADFLSKGSAEDAARARRLYSESCRKWHDGCARVVPEMLTDALRCCEAARARIRPGQLIQAGILASCFDEARRTDGVARARTLARRAFENDVIPECAADNGAQ